VVENIFLKKIKNNTEKGREEIHSEMAKMAFSELVHGCK